jgi:hypothetical protein
MEKGPECAVMAGVMRIGSAMDEARRMRWPCRGLHPTNGYSRLNDSNA